MPVALMPRFSMVHVVADASSKSRKRCACARSVPGIHSPSAVLPTGLGPMRMARLAWWPEQCLRMPAGLSLYHRPRLSTSAATPPALLQPKLEAGQHARGPCRQEWHEPGAIPRNAATRSSICVYNGNGRSGRGHPSPCLRLGAIGPPGPAGPTRVEGDTPAIEPLAATACPCACSARCACVRVRPGGP